MNPTIKLLSALITAFSQLRFRRKETKLIIEGEHLPIEQQRLVKPLLSKAYKSKLDVAQFVCAMACTQARQTLRGIIVLDLSEVSVDQHKVICELLFPLIEQTCDEDRYLSISSPATDEVIEQTWTMYHDCQEHKIEPSQAIR